MAQQYTYTYDKALDTFFVRDIETDKVILKCHNELVVVTFIHDVLMGIINVAELENPIDMTTDMQVEVE